MLTVTEWAERRAAQSLWHCRCDCGKMTIAYYCSLISGNTKSCGCLRGESHGRSDRGEAVRDPTYRAWCHAKERCYSPTVRNWHNYGGRGIQMSDEWRNSFSAFLCDMGDKPPGLTLDRIDVNGNYCKANCRWATWKEQANNTRKTIVLIFPSGERLTFNSAASIYGFNRGTIANKYQKIGHDATVSWLLRFRRKI